MSGEAVSSLVAQGMSRMLRCIPAHIANPMTIILIIPGRTRSAKVTTGGRQGSRAGDWGHSLEAIG